VIGAAEDIMLNRYRAALALTSLLTIAASPGHHRHARHAPRRSPAAAPAGIEIYSRRALRRARVILQLKLLELHQLQLDRVRRAIERALKAGQPYR
jgi:hypothetical protein